MKTLIAVPCMDVCPTLFIKSLVGLRVFGEVEFSLSVGSLVYDARNKLCEKAIDGNFDRVLWLDSDMVFQSDLFERLSARIDEGRDFVSGLYFTRKGEVTPVIYKSMAIEKLPDGKLKPVAGKYLDYPKDSIFPITACGFGAVMMKTSAIETVRDKFGLPFAPAAGFGEDLSFCLRMTECGMQMYCDSSIKCGHVAYREITEELWEERNAK